jgi:DNA invertase Pin-like site-specific DNA recombinase
MIQSKIQNHHTTKLAYIYLRQSTLAQVRFNQESTQRQYALQHKAQELGWPVHAIKILDGDLGMSGTQSHHREDFNLLVADVSMGKVGAVFALEASRLSRSCTDWHRLLELSALTGTLIIDEDGCYNPADFNDQLLLGLKGTMSVAELHFIRARLQGGRENKAKKGELRFPLPVGFCYDDQNNICLDADEQVRKSVQFLFHAFKETGTAHGVVRYFRKEKLQFPKRAYGGIWKGKLIWGTLTLSRAVNALKNPSYAGTYVYGRYTYQKKLSTTGQLQKTTVCLPIDQWSVVIKNHHESYISWEEYNANQEILKNNRVYGKGDMLPTAVREGSALLQGLLICSSCGHRLAVHYKGNNSIYPVYECRFRERAGLDNPKRCMSVRGDLLDQAIGRKILEAIKPAQIDIAIKAFEELERRSCSLDKQWQMKIQRADYEAQLAQRRYEEVDPSNRLVAATLEKQWNEALLTLNQIQIEYTEYKQQNKINKVTQAKDKIFSLAKDLPRLWELPSTSAKDRKRIIRLLIQDITIKKMDNSTGKKALLYIRWQGGAVEDLEVVLPKRCPNRWQLSDTLIEQIKQLATSMTDVEIVNKLNKEGLRTNKGNMFTIYLIRWIRLQHKIPFFCHNKAGEFSVKQVAEKFNVSHHVVRYWIARGIVQTRKIEGRSKPWVFLDAEKEAELWKWVESSTRITISKTKSLESDT